MAEGERDELFVPLEDDDTCTVVEVERSEVQTAEVNFVPFEGDLDVVVIDEGDAAGMEKLEDKRE